MLQDQGAAWGVGSGMPGSGLSANRSLRNLGLTSEQQVQQGIQNYNSTIPTVSRTQTVDPSLQYQIANRNATMAAAPVPAQAQSYAQQLFDKYLQAMRGPGGGTGGGMSPAGGTGGGGSARSPWGSPASSYYDSGSSPSSGYDQTQQDWYWQGWGDPTGAGSASTSSYDPTQQDWYWQGFGDPGSYGSTDLGGYQYDPSEDF